MHIYSMHMNKWETGNGAHKISTQRNPTQKIQETVNKVKHTLPEIKHSLPEKVKHTGFAKTK